MKKEKEQSSSPLVSRLILLGTVLVTITIVGAVGFFLILPTFASVTSVNQEVASENSKVERIEQSINSLKTQDKGVLGRLTKFLNILVPDQIDMLHFATLNEVVAAQAGVQITNIQLSKGKAPVVKPKPVKTTTVVQKQVNQTALTTATVTYTSNFDSLLKLIQYWFLADQIVGVNNIVISGQASGVINYTIIYDLPKSTKLAKAIIEDSGTLTKKQIAELESTADKIIYTATPSAKPLGKDNPFLQ